MANEQSSSPRESVPKTRSSSSIAGPPESPLHVGALPATSLSPKSGPMQSRALAVHGCAVIAAPLTVGRIDLDVLGILNPVAGRMKGVARLDRRGEPRLERRRDVRGMPPLSGSPSARSFEHTSLPGVTRTSAVPYKSEDSRPA